MEGFNQELNDLVTNSPPNYTDFTRIVFPPKAMVPARFEGLANFREVVFLGDVDFSGGYFECVLSFRRAQFRGHASFENAFFLNICNFDFAAFNKGASFRGAQFNAKNSSMIGTIFHDDAHFVGCSLASVRFDQAEFRGTADFTEAKFTGEGRFVHCHFHKGAVFRQMHSAGPLLFDEVTLEARINFMYARVEGGLHGQRWQTNIDHGIQIDFTGAALRDLQIHFQEEPLVITAQRAKFAGLTSIQNSEIESADFSLASIDGTMRLEQLHAGSLSFHDADILGRLSMADVRWKYPPRPYQIHLNFRNVSVVPGQVAFMGRSQTFLQRPTMDLSRALFAYTDMAHVRLSNVSFEQNLYIRRHFQNLGRGITGRSWVGDEEFIDEFLQDRLRLDREAFGDFGEREEAVLAQYPGNLAPGQIAEIYRRLRKAEESNLRYAEAGPYHVREMALKRHVSTSLAERLLLRVYGATSCYGQSYTRPLLILALSLFIIGFLEWSPIVARWDHGIRSLLLFGLVQQWFVGGLAHLPKGFAGTSMSGFFVKVWLLYLIGVTIVALRRNFRRGAADSTTT